LIVDAVWLPSSEAPSRPTPRVVPHRNHPQAAVMAYNTHDRRTAHSIAAENLQKAAIQEAVQELLAAEGIGNEQLGRIHAHYLGLYASPDPRDKAVGIRALEMAYKLTGAYEQHREKPADIFDDWTIEELDDFVKNGMWPDRYGHPGARMAIGGRIAIDVTPREEDEKAAPLPPPFENGDDFDEGPPEE